MKIMALCIVFFCFVCLTFAQIETKIVPADGAANDLFGGSVAMHGKYMVIGAKLADEKGKDAGSAYVYEYNGTNWIYRDKLLAGDGADNDHFGGAVAIYGDYIVIGAYFDDDKGAESGAVYIFKRSGKKWIEETKLVAGDGIPDMVFGQSVSIYGDFIAVGACKDNSLGTESGSVYIFKRSGQYWFQDSKITAGDGVAGDRFGSSVTIRGGHIAAGAPLNDDDGRESGSVYVFEYNGNKWTQMTKLTAGDAAAMDYFGISVSLGNGYIAVGSFWDDDHGDDSGSVYVFTLIGNNWKQQAKIGSSGGATGDNFGRFVNLSGDYMAVSAPGDDDHGRLSGSVSIYKRDGDNWRQTAKFVAGDGAAGDRFGVPVCIYENWLVAGAPRDDARDVDSGSAYIFKLLQTPQLLSVTDVPCDQGGKVTLKWVAPYMDRGMYVSHYSIWRALPGVKQPDPASLASKNINRQACMKNNVAGSFAWEWLANQKSGGFDLYSYTAETLFDSMSTTHGIHYYLVMVHTGDPEIFYPSKIDSGYSVDNLAPAPPEFLTAAVADSGIQLLWEKPRAPDVHHYLVYRDDKLLAVTQRNKFIDKDVISGHDYNYKLAAVDVHENQSEFSKSASVKTAVAMAPSELRGNFRLGRNYPNPFNAATTIHYDLASPARVRLVLVNLSGHRIRTLVHRYQDTGRYKVLWDGRDEYGTPVASGIYFYQLRANGMMQYRQMVLLR